MIEWITYSLQILERKEKKIEGWTEIWTWDHEHKTSVLEIMLCMKDNKFQFFKNSHMTMEKHLGHSLSKEVNCLYIML